MEGLNAAGPEPHALPDAAERRRVRARRDGHGGESAASGCHTHHAAAHAGLSAAPAAAALGPRPHHQQPSHEEPESAPSERRQKATAAGGMSDFERVLMGRVTLAELQQRGVVLPSEQLEYLRRVRGGC